MGNKVMFGIRLKNIRESKGMSLGELADALEKSASTVYGYEVNQIMPSHDTLCEIAKVFNMTIDELVGFEEGTAEKLEDWYKVFAENWRQWYELF